MDIAETQGTETTAGAIKNEQFRETENRENRRRQSLLNNSKTQGTDKNEGAISNEQFRDTGKRENRMENQ